MKIKTLIADDEPLVRERLRALIANDADLHLIAETDNGRAAVENIIEQQPELVFLDIQMPEFDGFSVVEQIGIGQIPVIVFVTAFDKYAVRAFEVHAFDYLLKPIDSERFNQTLTRAKNQIKLHSSNFSAQKITALLEDLSVERESFKRSAGAQLKPDRFLIQSAGRIVFLPVSEIEWIEPAGNYVSLHVGNKEHLLRETMNGIETRLNPAQFLRIQRSAIVNIDRIKELHQLFRGAYEVILHNGTRLTTSRGYHEKLFKMFNG